MKDKRLELKLSVRGDGSLSRNNLRSSTRSNRSNLSNSSSNLPVSEIFATDRYGAPQHRAFEILDKYRRQPVQYGYPAQSLPALNQNQQSNRYGTNSQAYPYVDQNSVRQNATQYPVSAYEYQPVYIDSPNQIYGTLPRTAQYSRQQNIQNPIYYTLPERSPRRVRISDNQPTVYDYGTFCYFLLNS